MAQFNPVSTSEELKELYKNYITTTFPIKNSIIRSNFEDLIDSDRVLWNGPIVSLTSKYKRGGEARKFLEECGFHQAILRSLKLDQFYKHQEDAIRLINQQDHVIVSTGTGSGKTEAFLLPILDYCLKNREKGVKAIIVYPMNALANDQMLRLRTFLYAINAQLPDPVTFARYTGQTPQDDSERNLSKISERCRLETSIIDTSFFSGCPSDCDQQKLRPKMIEDAVRLTCPNNLEYSNTFELLTRTEMKRSPPDILITNYVQLEYLLLRREDAPIFRSPSFRFLVFDEIHYYAGATGAEVALLIRRLKARLKEYSKKKVICIGTSATISSTSQAKEDISQFASLLFSENIGASNVVIGENEPSEFKETFDLSRPYSFSQAPLFSPEQIIDLNDDEFTELCSHFSESPENKIPPDQRLAHIGLLLRSNNTFAAIAKLIQDNPKPVADICQELAEQTKAEYSEDQIEQLVWSYLYYGGISYDPDSYTKNLKEPLTRAQIHLFFKTLGDRWPFSGLFACVRCLSVYTKPYDKCKSCGGIVEELGTCRECGAEFYRSVFQENPADNSINALSTIGKDNTLGFSRLGYNDDGYKMWQSLAEHDARFHKYQKCLACGSLSPRDSVACQICASDSLHLVSVSGGISKCPYCGRQYVSGADIVTPFYVSPNVTSRLIFDLNHSLLPEELKKMIVFTDSRQDASFMAGTIGEEHLTHLLRQILTTLTAKNDEISFERMQTAVLHEIRKVDPTYTGQDIKLRMLREMASAIGKRRSVENLGLVTFNYAGIWSVDTNTISAQYKIDDDVFKRFIVSILNEVRLDRALYGLHSSKIGRLPPHGFICARGVRNTNITKNLIAERGRYVQYARKVFPKTDALSLFEAVFDVLKRHDYLREVKVRNYEFAKDSENGYVIDADKISFKKPDRLYVCDTCRRVYGTVPDRSCAAWNCRGQLNEIDSEEYYREAGNFYTSFYKDRSPSRLKVREDTGYLHPAERQKLELAFRAGNLDMLVATPTLELGIDIGDVASIGLMKAPPSPAKYVQRVGRAGRVSKVSMASAFMFQNPIDLYYFDSPLELISGNIGAPALHIENQYILRRHVNSLILEEVLVQPRLQPSYYKKQMLDFVEDKQEDSLLRAVSASRDTLTDKIKSTFENLSINDERIVANFSVDFKAVLNGYNRERELLEEIYREVRDKKDEIFHSKGDSRKNQEERYRLNRMEDNIQSRNDDLKTSEFFSYLSKAGLIPRYAFPGRAVRVLSDDGEEYQERQMPLALYELALGKALYLNGRKKRVIGLPFAQDPEMLKSTEFFVCKSCKIFARESRSFSVCPECGAYDSAGRIADCHKPTSVVVHDLGIPKEQARELALVDMRHYLLQPVTKDIAESSKPNKTAIGELTLTGKREILTLACGLQKYDETSPRRFTVCQQCGSYLGGNFTEVEERKKQPHKDLLGTRSHQPRDADILSNIKLYHTFDTATLLISKLPFKDRIFVTTLKNAIINAAQRIVGAEDGEIEGIIKDDTLILYDNIEGAAGYVNLIFEKFDDIFAEVKILVLNCDCEHGCLKCLYSYRRSSDIRYIDKQVLLDVIRPIQRKEVE